MRTDIAIHISTGDLAFAMKSKGVTYPFSWVSNPSGLSRYIYGELEIPASLSTTTIEKGLSCVIPYTARHKEFYVRIKRIYGGDMFEYIQNPVDGSEWFLVKVAGSNVFASELIKISPSFEYTFMFDRGEIQLFSNGISDFDIVNANHQNSNMLLLCAPTNNYRYPASGVGMRMWINGNSINSEMISILRNEFELDGTPVISASYDFDNKNLDLKLNTSGVD